MFGWDVVGMVVVVGVDVMLFWFGDEVFYVGSIMWFGVNSEFYVVDEWIVVLKLCMFDFVVVVVLLFIVFIVWEVLFDWLCVLL